MLSHDDVIKCKHFSRYWPFVQGIHRWFPTQRPVTRNFDVFFDQRRNKRLSKQSRHRWLETRFRSLWRHRNCPQNPRTPPDPIGRFSNLRKHPIDFHGSHYLYGVAIKLSRTWLGRCTKEPLNRLNSTTDILFKFLTVKVILMNSFVARLLIPIELEANALTVKILRIHHIHHFPYGKYS